MKRGSVMGLAAGALVSATALAGEPILYSVACCDDQLREISTLDASTVSMIKLQFDDRTGVDGGTGLATDPTTGILYGVLKRSGGGRWLATIDNFSGIATVVGELIGESFAGIAFSCDGTLYGVTGDGSNTPESLFEIDKTDAKFTFELSLGIGTDGEMIGYNPKDQQLYHGSGHVGAEEVFFESIDPRTLETTLIDISETALTDEETQALTWWTQNGAFLWKQDHDTGPLYSVSPDAASVILIGDMDHQAKGLAFMFDSGCPNSCIWDLDGDGNVGTGDLIVLLGSWGDPYGTPDLIELLGAWGACP